MKVRKGDHVVEIQPMNQTVWEGRGYTLVRDEPKEPKAEQAAAEEKPKRKSKKRRRKPSN